MSPAEPDATPRPADKSPDAFRTISEVAEDLDLPQHVLRFWETRFVQIRPLKRGGGRRYYRPDDVDLLRGIRQLLYGEGYTIRGVQRILKDSGIRAVQAIGRGEQAVEPPPPDEAASSTVELAPPRAAAEARLGEPAPTVAVAALPAAAPRAGSLAAADRDCLSEALAELKECARVLAALKLADEPPDEVAADEHG